MIITLDGKEVLLDTHGMDCHSPQKRGHLIVTREVALLSYRFLMETGTRDPTEWIWMGHCEDNEPKLFGLGVQSSIYLACI